MNLYQCEKCKTVFVSNKMHVHCPDCYNKMDFSPDAIFICELPNVVIPQREDCTFI